MMFGYYLELALRSLKRNTVITALMVLAIGLGIGASMTMITVLHVMSGDPLPGRSSTLYVPMLNAWPSDHNAGVVPDGFTWPDAMNLLRAQRADAQAAMASGAAIVQPDQKDMHSFIVSGEYVTPAFFAMFGVPFREGAPWTGQQGEAQAPVVVLNGMLAHRLFGSASPLGKSVRLNDTTFRVVGVLQDWRPQPAFYHQQGHGVYGDPDGFFLPLRTAVAGHMPINRHMSCWTGTDDPLHSPKCTWLQFWVKLGSAAKAAVYRDYLRDYWHEQKDHGRFASAPNPPHLYDMPGWLAQEHLVPRDLKMQLWLGLGFLLVCMLSVVALLLAKFLRRSGEISVRRAMGARRSSIFMQFGTEAGVIGVVGGLLGLGIAQLGLWSVRSRPDDYAHLAHMDVSMLFGTIVFAIVVSMLAGLLPAWRACGIPPALQLKTL